MDEIETASLALREAALRLRELQSDIDFDRMRQSLLEIKAEAARLRIKQYLAEMNDDTLNLPPRLGQAIIASDLVELLDTYQRAEQPEVP